MSIYKRKDQIHDIQIRKRRGTWRYQNLCTQKAKRLNHILCEDVFNDKYSYRVYRNGKEVITFKGGKMEEILN